MGENGKHAKQQSNRREHANKCKTKIANTTGGSGSEGRRVGNKTGEQVWKTGVEIRHTKADEGGHPRRGPRADSAPTPIG